MQLVRFGPRGMGMKPPTFLKVGDEMRLGVSGLGEQRQTVVADV